MKIIIATLMLLWTTAVFAEVEIKMQDMPMQCFAAGNYAQGLDNRFGEQKVFASEDVNALDEQLFHELWLNPSTQTWTFLVLNTSRNWVCVIASGTGFVDLNKPGI